MAIGSKKDNARKYPGMGGSNHNPVNIAVKRAEAIERNAAWQALKPAEQIAKLDALFGEGLGAKRQRDKIARGPSKQVLVKAAVDNTPVQEQEAPRKSRAKDRRKSRQ